MAREELADATFERSPSCLRLRDVEGVLQRCRWREVDLVHRLASHFPTMGKPGRSRSTEIPAIAPVAQGIEHWFPKPGVAGSNPAGGANQSSARTRAAASPPTALGVRRRRLRLGYALTEAPAGGRGRIFGFEESIPSRTASAMWRSASSGISSRSGVLSSSSLSQSGIVEDLDEGRSPTMRLPQRRQVFIELFPAVCGCCCPSRLLQDPHSSDV